jgi:hypothetical protein
MMPSFTRKPWLLERLAPRMWVTFAPKIYCPVPNPQDFPAIIAHEKKHIEQQIAMGKWRWLFKYICSKQFRLTEEVEAIVAELAATDFTKRGMVAERYAYQLSGHEYRYAAASYETALTLICFGAAHNGVEL